MKDCFFQPSGNDCKIVCNNCKDDFSKIILVQGNWSAKQKFVFVILTGRFFCNSMLIFIEGNLSRRFHKALKMSFAVTCDTMKHAIFTYNERAICHGAQCHSCYRIANALSTISASNYIHQILRLFCDVIFTLGVAFQAASRTFQNERIILRANHTEFHQTGRVLEIPWRSTRSADIRR